MRNFFWSIFSTTSLTLFLIVSYTSSINAQSHPQIAVPDGYATGTTGGAGGEVVTVSSGSEFKAACGSSGKKIIVVQGYLGDVGSFGCSSDKTIVGANQDAGFKGNLRISEVSNIIIQNLTITNIDGVGTGDGIEVSSESQNIFVTKCTFVECADGSFDIKRGSDNITVSWCRFRYPDPSSHDFPNLIGHSDGNGDQDRGKLRVTLHHNWYDSGSRSRMPRVRFGSVHVYNNYYGCHGNNYCIGTGYESSIRVEGNYFDDVNDAWNDMNGMGNGAKIGWQNNEFVSTDIPGYAPNSWPVFSPPYDFIVDVPGDIKSIVTDPNFGAGNCGHQGGEAFELTVSIARGQGTVTPVNGSYREGQSVTLTATPENGWVFDHWEGGVSGNTNPATLIVDGDKNVSAYFVEDTRTYYSVTAQSSPGGTVYTTPPEAQLIEGTSVTVTADPYKGWTFAGWSGDFTVSDATYIISSLSSDISVIASFMPEDFFSYEAEYGLFHNAGAESDNTGFTGEGYVNFANEIGSSVNIPVYVDEAGEKTLTITFANGSDASRPMSIMVNGTQQIASEDFGSTGDWTSWHTKQLSLTLPQGAGTITFTSTGEDGGPNMDKIAFDKLTSSQVNKPAKTKAKVFFDRSQNVFCIQVPFGNVLKADVYSLDGRKILTKKFNIEKVSDRYHIPFDSVRSGVYLVRYEYDGTVSSSRVKVF